MYEQEEKKDNNRDHYHRCPICKNIFLDDDCILDKVKGYICPNNCQPVYVAPVYESPLNSDSDETSNNI